jgi:hypothetical protein
MNSENPPPATDDALDSQPEQDQETNGSQSKKPPPDKAADNQTVETVGVRNQTPRRLTVKFEIDRNRNHEVVFAPLQMRWLNTSEKQLLDYKELDTRGLILLEHKDKPEPVGSGEISSGYVTLFSVLFVVYLMGGFYMNDYIPLYSLYYWIGVPVALVVLLAIGWIFYLISKRSGWSRVRLGATQSLTLVLVMLVGLGLTTTIIYLFGDGPALLQSAPSLTLLTRGLQLTFIGIASLLPALLYYLFDRQQLGTLRERFESQIFNLDPTAETLGDVQTKYGSQLDELYGRDVATSQSRLVRGSRWPILVCTLVITIGWILTLQPVGTNLTIRTAGEILDFFLPQFSVLTFGFLGAYYFALNMIFRRYTRGDLQPKAYSHITVRIIIVVISAWIVEMLLGANSYTYLLVFLIGIVPDTFFTVLREISRNSSVVAKVLPQLQEKHPLTGLEGIDLYDRSRLAEEGVTNVESLAHHDLIDLILATRIPIPRLMDWVDQAILYLHLSEDDGGKGNQNEVNKTMHVLKHLGIRSASELERVIKGVDDCPDQGKKDALLSYLEGNQKVKSQGGELMAFRMETIYTAMQDDDWLENIRHWRKSKDVQPTTITFKRDGSIITDNPVRSNAQH